MSANLPLLLIVDDNPENLTVIGELLQPRYRVRAANAGPRALRLAGLSPQPDLILLDVMMPDMDGYEVLASLRADPATRDIPVIFLTALDSATDEERGLQLGAADYVAKPIRPAVLLARVRLQLELKQSRDRLHERIRQLESELFDADSSPLVRASPDGALARHARTLQLRDPFTGEHLLRCQAYIRVLAQQVLGAESPGGRADEQRVEQMVRSAALHDIGMSVIPQHVLLRASALNSEEAAQLRRHATLGAELIGQAEAEARRQLDFLRIAREMALHHHERWDGSGYPDGLSGEEIPLPARLVAVVGSFDQLVWPSGGVGGLTLEAALQAIRQGRGTRFDPAAVDAFERCFDQIAPIARTRPDGDAAEVGA